MNTRAGCPKPEVSGFATEQAAAFVARRVQVPVGRILTPRLCVCDWWHLTAGGLAAQRSASLTPKPGDGLLFKDVPDGVLSEAALRDVRGTRTRAEALALRHPHNLSRWRRSLKVLWSDIEQQFAARAGDDGEATRLWRSRAQVYRSVIAERRNEAQKRLDRAASLTAEQRYQWRCAEAAVLEGRSPESLAEVVELFVPLMVAA
ncbi:hypothetical protein WKI65_43170 [Streptomyces sp. MS1.AVA.3]|uniref:hypothetical protein n=1 Tax=Streptomyces decoyicus TaxID=249567 RepID=UPI0030C4E7FD